MFSDPCADEIASRATSFDLLPNLRFAAEASYGNISLWKFYDAAEFDSFTVEICSPAASALRLIAVSPYEDHPRPRGFRRTNSTKYKRSEDVSAMKKKGK